MLVRIDSRSETPIYRQIARAISEQIASGALDAGSRLPSARSLAGTMNINMHTVLKAYSLLEADGMVEMRRGRGGVVIKGSADLGTDVERVVAAAKRSRVALADLQRMIEERWT